MEHPEIILARNKQVHDILEDLDVIPDEMKDVLVETSDRLCNLLFDKTDEYTGPLSDGFQIEDIMAIVQIMGNWVLESYIKVLQSGRDGSVDELFNTTTLVHICIELLLSLQKKDVLSIELTHRFMMKSISKLFHPSMDDMLTTIKRYMEPSCSCLSSTSKREKKVNKFIHANTKRIALGLPSKKKQS